MAIQITKRPYEISFSGNPVHYELTSALATADATIFFEIRLQFRTLDGVFQPVAPLPYYPTAGVAQINVQDILHAQLQWQVPTFPTDEKTIQPVDGHAGIFYLEFREITPANPNPSWDGSESDFERVVVKGGINYFKWAGNNFFVNYFETVKPFFTWQKSGRMAAPTERMFLLWFNRDLYGTAGLVQRTTVYFTDGTQDFTDKEMPAGSAKYFYFLPAGATQLNLQSITPPGKAIHFWTIRVFDLINGTGDHSQVFKYYMDNRHDDNGRQLSYRNSLGGIDSVMVRGEIEQALDYQPQELDRATQPDYFAGHVVAAQRTTASNREVETFRGDIGHLPKEDQDRFRDLQLLREVYQPMTGKWWPVTIITKSFTLRKTKDFRFSMPIEWQLAFGGSVFYTPNVDLGDGVFTSNVCLAKITGLHVTVAFDDPDTAPTDALVTFTGTEVDPQTASTQFRWRILPTYDWQLATWASLPLSVPVPRNTQPTLEVQAICTNDIHGAKATAYIDTTEPDTSGGTPPPSNSIVSNTTSTPLSFTIYADDGTAVDTIPISVGASGTVDFALPLATYVSISLHMTGFSPSNCRMMVDGVEYIGDVHGLMVDFVDTITVGAGGVEIIFE